MKMEYTGNITILDIHPKTAFLCSRTISSVAVLRCYDWALEMKNRDMIVVSGFQSKIEKDVFRILARGTQPIIVVTARRLYKKLPVEFEKPLADGRLLIISTATSVPRVTVETAAIRNRYISGLADNIVFGYISEGSMLKELYEAFAMKSEILFSKPEQTEHKIIY